MEKESVNNTEVKTEKKKSNKGLLITLIVICSLFLAGLISCLVMLFVNPDFIYDIGKKTITITFDSDGGSKVEKIKFKQGAGTTLPTPTKEGYEFKGWFIIKSKGNPSAWEETDNGIGTELTSYWTKMLSGDVTLKAKWSKLEEDEMIMTINFDAKGGKVSGNNSNDSQSVVKCKDNAYTVEGLPKATKDGYNFMAWTDKNGTPILDGALLTCAETLDLYATYEKKEETKPTTQEKKYKCQTGYELKDTNKCVQTANANLACDSNWKLINGECFNPSVDTKTREGNRTCPEKTINGWTGTGYLYNQGRDYCAYYEMPSYTGANQQCANAGGHIIPGNSYKCFKYVGYEYAMSCASGTKYVEAQAFGGGSNPGCYYYKAANKVCPDGYSSTTTYGDCAKVIDATLE